MKWIDIIAAAMGNLRRRKLRSALTMLGVVIGTAAIVVTISLGYGAEATQMAALQSQSNLRLITVNPYFGYSGMDEDESTSGRRITKLTDTVIRQMRKLDHVDAITPIASFYGPDLTLKTGKYETQYMNIVGVYPNDFKKFVKLKEGTGFTSSLSKMEFVMSEPAMIQFVDPKKNGDNWVNYWDYAYSGKELPLAKINWLSSQYDLIMKWYDYEHMTEDQKEPELFTKELKAKMVGILDIDINNNDMYMFTEATIVNINWLKKFIKSNKTLLKEIGGISSLDSYDQVLVMADNVDNVEALLKELKEMGASAYSPLQYAQMMREQIQTMQGFLGFIGMVSMFVAALSIANTMMMSIYERTREIGVMKVLGCRLGNIRMMFLSEAALIGLFGGLLGLMFSYGLSYALNNVAWLQNMVGQIMNSTSFFGSGEGGSTSIIPPTLSLGTWFFVIVVSVGSGFYPAQRAMKLSSLAAIRSAE